MDANQIEKMKALALAAGDWAPPEPWEDDRNYSDREIRGLEFCAAANPAAVLELIAEVERLHAAPAAGTVEKDAERWQFFDANAQSTINGRLFAEWLAFDAAMEYGSRAAALDAIAAHTKQERTTHDRPTPRPP